MGSATSGFSLVELIVATAITLVLATLLISASGSMLSAWNRSRGSLTTANQAKLALDQLTDDLQSLYLRNDDNVWLAATVTGTQAGFGDAGISTAVYTTSKPMTGGISTVLAPPGGRLDDYRFGHVGVWLRFFTQEPDSNLDNTNLSAPRAIAYQIARLPVNTGAGNLPRYFFFRSSVRAWESSGGASTFSTGYQIDGDNAYNNPGAGNSGAAFPGSVRRPDRSLIVGSDVIDFGVRIYVRDSTGNLIERFPVDRSRGGTTQAFSFVTTGASSATLHGVGSPPSGLSAVVIDFPAVIEVMFRVLSDEGARLIQALESGKVVPPGGAGNFDAYWWELAAANSSAFTRRIEIKGSGARSP